VRGGEKTHFYVLAALLGFLARYIQTFDIRNDCEPNEDAMKG